MVDMDQLVTYSEVATAKNQLHISFLNLVFRQKFSNDEDCA